MNFYAISALINLFASVILGGIVYFKNRKAQINILFAIFTASVALWSFGYYFWQISTNSEAALFWSRTLMAGAIFIPVTYFNFVLVLTDLFQKRKKFLIFSYFIFFAFFLSNFTPLFVNRIEPLYSFEFWPLPGPAFHIFLVIWFAYVIYSTFLLFQKYKLSQGIKKEQLKYVFIGMVIGFAGGSTNYFLWYKIPIPPFANILVSVYVGAIAYAIIRYRLMDIRIIVRKIFIYFGVAVFTYGIFYLVAWSYAQIFGNVFAISGYLAGIFIAPAFVFSFDKFNKWLRVIANKYFFASLSNYQGTITRLSEELNYLTDLDQIINSIVDTIKQTMQLDRAGVLLIDETKKPVHYTIAKTIGFNEANGISLVKESFLTQYFVKNKIPLITDEFDFLVKEAKTDREKSNFLRLKNHMEKIEASLCLPLLSGNKLIGIIVLGSKISKEAYTKEDLELLSTLSYQAGIAIDNAILYQKVSDLSKNLQKKVDEQTKDIQAKAEHLKKLLEMRSEFLDIASHQLRTPTSVIIGMTSMLKEPGGKLDKEKKDRFIDSIFQKSKKLEQIINDILSASEMDTEEFTINPDSMKQVQPEETIDRIMLDAQEWGSKRSISVKFIKPKKPVSTILADQRYLEHTISNLVDNAVKYTMKGFVKISLEEKDKRVYIKVQDSGIGIPKEDIPKLFGKFIRAKNARQTYTDGSGLGLFIIKKIVDAHKGAKIEVDSVENKGTTFILSFPIAERSPKIYAKQKI